MSFIETSHKVYKDVVESMSANLIKRAKEIAAKMAGSYSNAVREIEKLQKNLSDHPDVKKALLTANEETLDTFTAEEISEKIKPFMISYSKNGQHAGFEDGDSLADIQNKAASLKKKGFTIDKMGRYNPPVKKEEIEESASQVQVRPDGKGNFNLMFRGKEIGYYHREGSKYIVYYDKDGDDYDQSDEVSNEMQAKKLAYDNMNEEIQEGIKPYVSMQRNKDTGKMNYVVLDKDEKEAFRSSDERVAKDYWKKNYDKLKESNYIDLKGKMTDSQIANIKKVWSGKTKADLTQGIKDMISKMDPITKLGIKQAKINVLSDLIEATMSPQMIATLKREYEPMRGRKITAARARQLMNILDKLDDKNLNLLAKQNIPFVSSGSKSKLMVRNMKVKITDIDPFKEDIDLDEEMFEACWTGYKQVGMKNKGGKKVPNCVPEDNEIEEKYTVQITKKDGTTIELGKYNTPAEAQKFVDMYGKGAKVKKEELEIEEGKIKDIFTANKEGESIAQIAKRLKISLSTVKSVLGEAISVKAFKNAVDPSKKGLEISKTGGMSGTIMIKDKKELKDLETKIAQAKRLYNIKETKAMSDREKRLQRAKDMIKYYDAQKKAALKGKNKDLAKKMLKNDLSKSQIKKVHKVADDLPKKDFKDRYGKEKGDAVRFGTATNMVKKKLGMKEEKRLYVEMIAGLKKKSEKSGMSYGILKKVYDRGMAAWKGGHRPGASQQQWAFARVNSFITKSSGTWGGADKDLAAKVKGK